MVKLEKVVSQVAVRSPTHKSSLLRNISLKEVSVEEVDCSWLSIRGCDFDTVDFKKGIFKKCVFFSALICDGSFNKIDFLDVDFFLPFFHEIIFDSCTFTDTRIISGDLFGVVFKNCKLQNVNFTTKNTRIVTYFENVSFENCELKDVSIEVIKAESGDVPKASGIKIIEV